MKCRKLSLVACPWLDGWNYSNYLVSGMSFFISCKSCLGRQVLKLLFIVCSVVRQSFQGCFPHVEAGIQKVADTFWAKARAGQSSGSLCSSIKLCFCQQWAALCHSDWSHRKGEHERHSHCSTDFWDVCGFVLGHCWSPGIVCDWVKKGEVTDIHLMFLIKSHGSLV